MSLAEAILTLPAAIAAIADQRFGPLPKLSYENLDDIDAEVAALRKTAKGFSMSRSWWRWDRLLTRYQDYGRQDKNTLKILRAVFVGGIFDRYHDLIETGEGEKFYLFYTHRGMKPIYGGGGHGGWGGASRLRIYEALVAENMLDAEEQAEFRKLISQSLNEEHVDFNHLEIGANNRPYANNGGVAIALRLFPDMPRAKEIRAWLNKQWRELAEYGDTSEVNFHPYGPLYFEGMIDLAENLGKFETEREFIYALTKRYRDQLHGSGVKGCPNAGAIANRDLKGISENPWQMAAFDPKEVHMWYRMTTHFKDPIFLWAAEQALLGGRGPGCQVPAEYQKAYDERFKIFNDMGLKPETPAGKSAIACLSPLQHRVPERLYLHAGREAGKPFVSYYIHDRNNEYMHCFGDARGRLYEYVVEGTKLLHSSGKYNGISVGQGAYDMLIVLHPNEAFPFNPPNPEVHWQRDGFHGTMPNVWNTASGTLHMIPGSRTAPDSPNWSAAGQIELGYCYKRTDDPMGFSHGNMDGLWKLNDDYQLKTVSIVLHGAPIDDKEEAQETETVFIQNLRLAGPKGDIMLVKFDELPKHLTVTRERYTGSSKGWEFTDKTHLTGDALKDILRITDDGKHGSKVLCVKVEQGTRLTITVGGFDMKFNVDRDYTRLAYDYKAISKAPYLRREGWRYELANCPMLVADMFLNSRSRVHVHQNQGGILEVDALRVENKGDDSFGQFTYRNYFAAHSKWTRQTVLTEEGILVVRDVYLPGKDVDDYSAGPNWILSAEGETVEVEGRKEFKPHPSTHDGKQNWFDAPGYEHAWWQDNPKRLTLYIHHEKDGQLRCPKEGRTYGQMQHKSSPDIHHYCNSSFVKAKVKAGKPEIFLSLLVPHDKNEKGEDVVECIKTNIAKDGKATAIIGAVEVAIDAVGNWAVRRG